MTKVRAWSISLAAAVVAGLAMGMAPSAQSVALLPADPDRRCAWPVVYPKDANYAWPDTHAAYINQAVVLGPKEKIVITGTDPKARYWSITTYNYEDREVIDRVNDVTVKRANNGTWTITVSPRQNAKDPNSLQAAPLPRAGESPSFRNVTVIMYRVYLSETRGYSGGPLPTMTLHHGTPVNGKKTERLKACVGDQIRPPEGIPPLDVASGVPSEYFVRAEGGRFFPSRDTAYLVADVPYNPERILVVTGKAPRVRQDVRYWSLCQNVNQVPLPVVDCVSDRNVLLKDGKYAIAIIGPGQVPDRSAYPDVTFVDWAPPGASTPLPNAFLIMRHILPSEGFAGSIDKVTLGQPAASAMGDYAPIIEHVPLAELRAR